MKLLKEMFKSEKKVTDYLNELNEGKVLVVFDHGMGDVINFFGLFDTLIEKYPNLDFYLGFNHVRKFNDLHEKTYPIYFFNEQYNPENFNYPCLGQYPYYNMETLAVDGPFEIIIQTAFLRHDFQPYQKEANTLVKMRECKDQRKYFNSDLKFKQFISNRKIDGPVNNFSKLNLCAVLEFGIHEPITKKWKCPVQKNNENSDRIGVHFNSNSGRTTRGIEPESFKNIWKKIKEIGYDPFETNMDFSAIRKEHISIFPVPAWINPEETLRYEKDNLLKMMEEIAKCKYFIGSDSGPLHLAAEIIGEKNCICLEKQTPVKSYYPNIRDIVRFNENTPTEEIFKTILPENYITINLIEPILTNFCVEIRKDYVSQKYDGFEGDKSFQHYNMWKPGFEDAFNSLEYRDEIILGPHFGELGDELMYWSGFVRQCKIKYPEKRIIISTRKNRVDLYSDLFDEIHTFEIPDEYSKFRIVSKSFTDINGNVTEEVHNIKQEILNDLESKYPGVPIFSLSTFPNSHTIQPVVFPPIIGQVDFKFEPREKNKEVIENILKENTENRKVISVVARYRRDMDRNWSSENWKNLLNYLNEKYFVFVIGTGFGVYRTEEFKKNLYYLEDYNNHEGVSDIGLTIEAFKNSSLTFGTQTASVVLSNMVGCPTVIIGHQLDFHCHASNVYDTNSIGIFSDVVNREYNIDYKKVLQKIEEYTNE